MIALEVDATFLKTLLVVAAVSPTVPTALPDRRGYRRARRPVGRGGSCSSKASPSHEMSRTQTSSSTCGSSVAADASAPKSNTVRYSAVADLSSPVWCPLAGRAPSSRAVPCESRSGNERSHTAKPASGYDKTNMAVDIYELTTSLELDGVRFVGHDIGLMVAYAYAAQFPELTERVVPSRPNWWRPTSVARSSRGRATG